MLQNSFRGKEAKSFGLVLRFSSSSVVFSTLHSAHKDWQSNLPLSYVKLTFSSSCSAPGPAEGASRSARFFANSAWLMAASWSFLRPSVQPRNWPPSKPARKMTVPASGSSLSGPRYVCSSEGDPERDLGKKRRHPKLTQTENENRTK